jgi:hypothetical protein
MKVALFFLSFFFITNTVYSQTLNTDTLVLYDITLETGDYMYFFPNGNFFYLFDEQNMDFQRYGNWKIVEDSVIVNVKLVRDYVGREEYEKRIDTNYFFSYKLDPQGRPITRFEIANLRTDVQRDHFLDKLR